MDADALARAAADAMWAADRASAGLGMALESVAPGEAVLTMRVTEAMLNGHGTCHGGFVFALADSAFAFACNSRNQRAVAAACAVTFLRPARAGDLLRAHAAERALEGRTGLYDVRVTRGEETVAEFRGTSRTVGGTVVPADA